MDFKDIQTNWKQVDSSQKSQADLQLMTCLKHHPQFKRMRIKFAIEIVLFFFFLSIYYDWFDGHTKPLWAHVLLVGTTAFMILIDITGWVVLRHPIRGDDLKNSLGNFLDRLKQIRVFSLMVSVIHTLSVLLYFGSSATMTPAKYIGLGAVLLFLALATTVSARNWTYKIGRIEETIQEFDIG